MRNGSSRAVFNLQAGIQQAGDQPAKLGRMNTDEFRKLAERCRRLANAETNEELKQQLIAMSEEYAAKAQAAETQSSTDGE